MARYFFNLLDNEYNDMGCLIPDGSHKSTAVNYAKRWMAANQVTCAQLEVSSMRTSNILDIIEIEL